MTWSRVIVLRCNNHPEAPATFLTTHNTVVQARHQAQVHGWSITFRSEGFAIPSAVDNCPPCTLKRKDLLPRDKVSKEGQRP